MVAAVVEVTDGVLSLSMATRGNVRAIVKMKEGERETETETKRENEREMFEW